MSINAVAIVDAVASHASAAGIFERVNQHEPKSAPGNGLSAAVWVDKIRAYPAASGLNSTTVVLTLKVRVYSPMIQEPQDAIDPNIVAAVDALMTAYSGDYELGGLVRNVDLLGSTADAGLSADAGYINQDNKLYRVMDITVPLILNDVFEQEA